MGHAVARIGIVGGGWRARTFHTVARALPERFRMTAGLVRTERSARESADEWGIPVSTSVEEFLRTGPFDFVLVCVPRDVAPELVVTFARLDIPVLCETPLAPDVDGLRALYGTLGAEAPVQVAEQYRFQPHHAARLAAVRSGRIGVPTSAALSVAHDYHSVSLLRGFLRIGFERATLTASYSQDRLARSLSFDGWSPDLSPTVSERITATLKFPDRGILGIHDFEGEQYFSPIRSRHLTVRGDRGELVDDTVHFLRGPGNYAEVALARQQTGIDGDLEGSFLRRILLGEEVAYDNPFGGARLSDDELAIAEVLHRMARFARERTPFYGMADASEDHYLALLMHEAARSGRAVTSEPQPWHTASSVFAA